MKARFEIGKKILNADLSNPLDLSIPYEKDRGVKAWYVEGVKIQAVQAEGFSGSVADGGNVNFRDVAFNPHGNGTHTECLGHIAPKVYSVNECLKDYFFHAFVLSVSPREVEVDWQGEKVLDGILGLEDIKQALGNIRPQAIIIRSLPNPDSKKNLDYSSSNPPYLEAGAAKWLGEIGIEHLLIDLPSVDREEDGGALLAHKAFWEYPENPQMHKTITELIYVPQEVEDGEYLLNLQMAPLENDASPSRPVLYPLL